MAGSEAEERIRAKVVETMRRRWADGRIVHELMLEQGGVRIDVACITPDRLIVAEIKSERDVLTRTKRQIERSMQVADEVWFVFQERHAPTVRDKLLPYYVYPDDSSRGKENPDRVDRLRSCQLYMERENDSGLWAWPDGHPRAKPNPRDRWFMLWREEMLHALGQHFGGALLPGHATMTRGYMTDLAVEHMSGREIRRAVCAELRHRPFPRADAPPAEDLKNAPATAAG